MPAEETPENRLYSIVAQRQYLDSEGHELNHYVKEIREVIAGKLDGDAHDLLDRLEKEIEVEQEALARAFKLFDNTGKNALNFGDLKNMNRYLGFPSEDADIKTLMDILDEDKSGAVSFKEFDQYVGKVGGSHKLFEERQKRIASKMGRSLTDSADIDSPVLMKAGIDKEAQAYWKMVVPSSEFVEAAKLVQCQCSAVSHIRRLAKKNHQEALPKLQDRVHRMGFPDDHLWLALAWIRELAPVIVHLNLDKMLKFLEEDTHYRNQFETASSGGLLKPEVRKKWERDLFGGTYDRASGFERPKYGVQNVMNDHRGVVRCAQYGDSYLILKDVRLRCTFSPEDSANLKAEKLAVLDFYAHVLSEYSEAELKETLKVANSAESALLGDSSSVGSMKYKEAQIHGELAFGRHVERLVAHTRHRDKGQEAKLKAMCARHGFGFTWMDQEQKRMRDEAVHRLGGAAWQERLQKLQEEGGDIEVPEGFCRVGCGRRCAPGLTRAKRPYTTCCRGCIMGFGHDRLCGQIDPSKVGPGLCKMGCGLKVAPGADSKGRPLTTCCRGCALGMGHDKSCQQTAPAAAAARAVAGPGMCKMGCGRKVAPGKTPSGKDFDTCCRGCAQGKGHDGRCAG